MYIEEYYVFVFADAMTELDPRFRKDDKSPLGFTQDSMTNCLASFRPWLA